MKTKTSIWQRLGLHSLFLKEAAVTAEPSIPTPDQVFRYITDKFNESTGELSFGNRIVFYHEYIICFNAVDYQEYMANKQGLFGLIAQESVRAFYEILASHRAAGKTVEPSAPKWVFRFVSHPDYARGDLGFIGKLLPGSEQRDENVRVTFIPRQTGIAETFGYYEIPYGDAPQEDDKTHPTQARTRLARLETIVPDKAFAGRKLEYFITDVEVLVTGPGEAQDDHAIFQVPSTWVDTPHLGIQYNPSTNRFFLASFGEKTLLNEKEVVRSDLSAPAWVELPINSKMLLNGIVGISIFKP
jgi:hypothetical protein